jgi:hypothetical protein
LNGCVVYAFVRVHLSVFLPAIMEVASFDRIVISSLKSMIGLVYARWYSLLSSLFLTIPTSLT